MNSNSSEIYLVLPIVCRQIFIMLSFVWLSTSIKSSFPSSAIEPKIGKSYWYSRFINSTNTYRRSIEWMEWALYFLSVPSEHLDFCIELVAGTKMQIACLIKIDFRWYFLVLHTFICFSLPSTLMMIACFVIIHAEYFKLIKQM